MPPFLPELPFLTSSIFITNTPGNIDFMELVKIGQSIFKHVLMQPVLGDELQNSICIFFSFRTNVVSYSKFDQVVLICAAILDSKYVFLNQVLNKIRIIVDLN